jgi:pimeloyl-ACP methyl ester carboxylesterase
VRRSLLASGLLLAGACHTPVAVSGGPPKPGAIPSTQCDGKAPLDPALEDTPGVRASWFNDPSGNERLYVLEAGQRSDKPTLVLIHGVGSIGTADYYPVLAALGRERHVLAVDLPGFGRSNPEDEDYGPERLARSVDVVVRTCASGKIDVLGHSSGGALAVLFAAQRADVVRRLILVDVAGILRPEVLLHGQLHQVMTPTREKVPLFARGVEATGGLAIDALQALVPNVKKVGKSGLLGKSPGVLAATALLDYNFGHALAGIRAPTLILWGARDYVVPTRIAELLDDRIAQSQLTYIPDAGHVPMKDQPGSMSLLVNEYLDQPLAYNEEPDRPPPASVTRDGTCFKQADVTLEGDYDEIAINQCERFRLHQVRARRVAIRKSQGRLDDVLISEGLTVDEADLFVTGGALHGVVALDSSDSKLDVAGVEIAGSEAAVRMRKQNEIVFSVTPIESPKTSGILHEELKVDAAKEL